MLKKLFAEELKQKYCSMDESAVTVQTYDFHLRASGQDTRRYQFKTYDETMLSVMVGIPLFIDELVLIPF